MPQAIGANARLSFVQETTWGTTPASPSMKMLKALTPGLDISVEIEKLVSNAVNASRGRSKARGGNRTVGGKIPFELPLLGFGTLLKHAIGPVTTTGAGPYTHVIKRGALPAGLTLEVGYTDIARYHAFAGCRINQMDLQIGPQGFVTGSLDMIGKSAATPSGTSLGTPTSVEHDPFVHHEAAFLEGGLAVTLLNYSLSSQNDLDPVRGIGSRDIVSLSEGRGDLTGSVTVLFENDTYTNKVLNETASSLKCTFTVAGGSLEILLPRIKYFGKASPGIQTDKGVVQVLEFQAERDDVTEMTDIKVTLVNTEATI